MTTNVTGASLNDKKTVGVKPVGPATPPVQPPLPTRKKNQEIHVSPSVLDAARKDSEQLLRDLRTSLNGLTEADAEGRARTTGPNQVA